MNGSRGLLAGLMRARVAILVIAVIAALLVLDGRHLVFLLGVVIFVVALVISVMLHELGHFLTAKKFHMRVTQFFLGFGTTLWSFFRGETEYGVKALPFGGFVKISGMTSMEEIDVADEPRSFRKQPGWQRIIVLAAGSPLGRRPAPTRSAGSRLAFRSAMRRSTAPPIRARAHRRPRPRPRWPESRPMTRSSPSTGTR